MDSKLLITTKMLMDVLSAGKSSAEFVGEKAEAKVRVGSRIFWYLPKILRNTLRRTQVMMGG